MVSLLTAQNRLYFGLLCKFDAFNKNNQTAMSSTTSAPASAKKSLKQDLYDHPFLTKS